MLAGGLLPKGFVKMVGVPCFLFACLLFPCCMFIVSLLHVGGGCLKWKAWSCAGLAFPKDKSKGSKKQCKKQWLVLFILCCMLLVRLVVVYVRQVEREIVFVYLLSLFF